MAGALREHLVAYFEEHHKLLEAEALQLLLSDRQPLALSRELLDRTEGGSPFVTREMVEAVLARRRAPAPRAEATVAGLASNANARRPAEPFELLSEGFTGPPVATQPIAAYGALFQSRYRALARMLRGRPELPNLRPIRELRAADGVASVIGMVSAVRETPQRHHLILTVDDETGSLEVLVPKDSPGSRVTFLPDEVVGLKLAFGKEPGRIPRVAHVERPDVPSTRAVGRAASSRRVIFLSDLHVGSRSFLNESWAHLVEFLRGRGPYPDLASSIDYVVIAGDLVDGIGIYPRQERDLAIADVVEQYTELGRRLAELPDRLTIVAIPGNHDAVSPAEPQPALPANLAFLLPPNVRTLANPSTFALSGVVVEAYHGRSFDDLIPAIPKASYARPTEVMKRMLEMRHLAPIYGDRTPLAPLPRDGLVIDPSPDILVTGHAHTYGVDHHRGVLLLNASTWQAETEYQRMRNIQPVPGRAAVVDLANLGLVSLDFSAGRPTVLGPDA
ncbi:MAG TPA: metallophosphoesterase [Thermoplasmata archaeon]|nr:metallophosphoesterase [Thermoplasmata archaeon]